MGFVNTIITHITNGNKNEERAQEVLRTSVMRGPERSGEGEYHGRNGN